MIKIQGGTPNHSVSSLCLSCNFSVHVKGKNGEEFVRCQQCNDRLITFSVLSCSFYENKATASLIEMRKIAWIVESRVRGPVGFSGEVKREIVVNPPDPDRDTPQQCPSPTS